MGEVMQSLVDAEQPPEAGLGRVVVEKAVQQPLGAVDGEMDDEIDASDPHEGRRHDRENDSRANGMDADMRQQRKKPAGRLLLAVGHPRRLKQEIGEQVLDEKREQGRDGPGSRNHVRHTRPR